MYIASPVTVLLLGLQSVIPMPSDVEFDFHSVEDLLHMLSHSSLAAFFTSSFPWALNNLTLLCHNVCILSYPFLEFINHL